MQKKNLCTDMFYCNFDISKKDCIYYRDECREGNDLHCNSAIAMVNTMVLKMKELGLSKDNLINIIDIVFDVEKEL